MYVSMSRLRVAPELVDDLVSAFRARLGAVDGWAGFQGLEVWCSDREPGEVLMVSRWSDRASFTAYMRSADHRTSHARIPAALQKAIRLERLEHLHTYDVVAT
jgi:heme-degrading monooxygenase HmoA